MADLSPIFFDGSKTIRIHVDLPGIPPGSYMVIQGITVLGQSYSSFQEACESLGVSTENTERRLKAAYRHAWAAGGSIDSTPSATEIDRVFFPRHLKVKGQFFRTPSEAIKHFKVPADHANRLLKTVAWDDNQEVIDAIFDKNSYKSGSRPEHIYVKGAIYHN